MQEDFLHYIWKFKKFDFGRANTVDGCTIEIISAGVPNFNAGPDFFFAKIKLGEQVWVGNVEIHIRSSNWYAHHHEKDPNYDNVILHVVWEHDVEIFRENNNVIPTLELKPLVAEDTKQSYRNLLLAPNVKWINCENDFSEFEDFLIENWLERMYLEKLQEKSKLIKELLKASENNWEAVLFQLLAKSYGLKVNAGAFLSMAQSVDFKIVQKIRSNSLQLEALFFGQSGLLEKGNEDLYHARLKQDYHYLKRKYRLENSWVERVKYFRLRPDNFPNIRLSQLATLYSTVPHLFSSLLKATTRQELSTILEVAAATYWNNHYNFGRPHRFKNKKLTGNFIDLLIINTVIPIKFYYMQTTGTGDSTFLLNLIGEIRAEKNAVISRFNSLRPGIAKNALNSQALLHLKNRYCDKNACLNCNLGVKLICMQAP